MPSTARAAKPRVLVNIVLRLTSNIVTLMIPLRISLFTQRNAHVPEILSDDTSEAGDGGKSLTLETGSASKWTRLAWGWGMAGILAASGDGMLGGEGGQRENKAVEDDSNDEEAVSPPSLVACNPANRSDWKSTHARSSSLGTAIIPTRALHPQSKHPFPVPSPSLRRPLPVPPTVSSRSRADISLDAITTTARVSDPSAFHVFLCCFIPVFARCRPAMTVTVPDSTSQAPVSIRLGGGRGDVGVSFLFHRTIANAELRQGQHRHPPVLPSLIRVHQEYSTYTYTYTHGRSALGRAALRPRPVQRRQPAVSAPAPSGFQVYVASFLLLRHVPVSTAWFVPCCGHATSLPKPARPGAQKTAVRVSASRAPPAAALTLTLNESAPRILVSRRPGTASRPGIYVVHSPDIPAIQYNTGALQTIFILDMNILMDQDTAQRLSGAINCPIGPSASFRWRTVWANNLSRGSGSTAAARLRRGTAHHGPYTMHHAPCTTLTRCGRRQAPVAVSTSSASVLPADRRHQARGLHKTFELPTGTGTGSSLPGDMHQVPRTEKDIAIALLHVEWLLCYLPYFRMCELVSQSVASDAQAPLRPGPRNHLTGLRLHPHLSVYRPTRDVVQRICVWMYDWTSIMHGKLPASHMHTLPPPPPLVSAPQIHDAICPSVRHGSPYRHCSVLYLLILGSGAPRPRTAAVFIYAHDIPMSASLSTFDINIATYNASYPESPCAAVADFAICQTIVRSVRMTTAVAGASLDEVPDARWPWASCPQAAALAARMSSGRAENVLPHCLLASLGSWPRSPLASSSRSYRLRQVSSADCGYIDIDISDSRIGIWQGKRTDV
ncbi:hypothetical protein EVG20_g9293 [Dentipellis fragilis]|uniref:Uncharacterized protein n=1 Tax=Dentipellis fragilis TaxID=205917 RepID=A0A4Y9Y3Z6_9AGAM|nr:hypothetical protein EVG20_g9293 [Dentipellis fragilis]